MTHIVHSEKMLDMRVFLSILLLIFILQSWAKAKADNIKDFEIQGISLGDSVLNYYSKNQILNAEKIFFPKSKKYFRVVFNLENSNLYDAVAFYLKDNDEKFKIYALEGFKIYNYKQCKGMQKEISNDLRKIFSNYKENSYENKHNLDSESTYMSFDFDFNEGSAVRIICTDWSSKMENNGYPDSLAIYLYNPEFLKWLNNEAY